MAKTLKLLSGNEALALGAYHAGVQVAAAYPGTPSTEILENLARFDGIYAEWSTNEKVAMEAVLGAAYAGARAMVSMKHVGLNVASDPFMAASITGVNAGMVVVCADDPQIHSSQNEQDNRHYARFAKMLGTHLYRERPLVLLRCARPKATSRPGESDGEFSGRLRDLQHEARDLAVEKLRKRYAPKLARLADPEVNSPVVQNFGIIVGFRAFAERLGEQSRIEGRWAPARETPHRLADQLLHLDPHGFTVGPADRRRNGKQLSPVQGNRPGPVVGRSAIHLIVLVMES